MDSGRHVFRLTTATFESVCFCYCFVGTVFFWFRFFCFFFFGPVLFLSVVFRSVLFLLEAQPLLDHHLLLLLLFLHDMLHEDGLLASQFGLLLVEGLQLCCYIRLLLLLLLLC